MVFIGFSAALEGLRDLSRLKRYGWHYSGNTQALLLSSYRLIVETQARGVWFVDNRCAPSILAAKGCIPSASLIETICNTSENFTYLPDKITHFA